MFSFTSGIPQSDANPLYQPFDLAAEFQAEENKALTDWQRESFNRLDQAVLDPDNAFEGFDLDFDKSPAKARQSLIIDSWLEVASGGQPAGTGLARNLLRDEIAHRDFDGRGVGDDAAFYGEIQKNVQGRKDAKDLDADLASQASTSELVRSTSDAGIDSMSFALWREKAKTMPGYQPGLDAAYYERWNEIRAAQKANLEPYLGPLSHVWANMRDGGSDWFTAYKEVPEDKRPAFMASLALLARTLPAEEQASLWAKVVTTNRRAWQTAARDTFDFLGDKAERLTAGYGRTSLPEDATAGDYQQALETTAALEAGDEQRRADDRAFRNFTDDIERIRDQTYDPVKAIGISEKVATGIVSTLPFMASAAVPGVGTGIVYAQTERMLTRDFRRSFMEGKDGITMSDAAATDLADRMGPVVAVPYAALEHLQVEGMLGKLPIFERALKATANRISNAALRFGARTAGTAAGETLIENTQDFLPALAQEAAHALSQDVPGVVWSNGKDGFLDGYWENTAVTFAVMLPLSVVAGAGGIQKDARAKAFAQATDDQILATGVKPQGLGSIREAQSKGLFSMDEAIEHALADRDPLSPEAKAAVDRVESAANAQTAAVEEAQRSGAIPSFTRTPDGWAVYDGETGTEVGKATTADEALRLGMAHSAAIDEKNADQVAYLGSLLEGTEARAASQQATTFEVAPGKKVTTTQQAAESEADEARILAQVRAREAVEGTGNFADIVLGSSTTAFKQNVRETVNRINAGGSLLTVFHEDVHGFYQEAIATGRLTRDETIAAIRGFQSAMGDRVPMLLPEGDVTDTQLQEAVSDFMEAEILKNRKKDGKMLPAGVITRNLTAAARLAPGAAQKFARFVNTVRAFWGATFQRAISLKKAIREGRVQQADIDAFVSKLMGLEVQDEHNAAAAKEAAEIVGEPAPSFSLGPAKMADILAGNALSRIKDPEAKAKVFENLISRMGRLRKLRDEVTVTSTSPNSVNERFTGAEHEQALSELEDARDAAIEEHEKTLRDLKQTREEAIADAREEMLGILGPDSGKSPAERKAAREARRQAVSKAEADFATAREKEASRHRQALAALDAKEEALAKRGAVSDAVAKAQTKAADKLAATRDTLRQRAAQARRNTLNALALLDGMLAVLPAEVRGKVGGFVQLARLTTDEARLKFLTKHVDKMETALDAYLGKEYRKDLDKLVESAAPRKDQAGKKRNGHLGAEAHRYFQHVAAAISMDEDTLKAALAKVDEKLLDEDNPDALADLAEEWQILRTFGNFDAKSLIEKHDALDRAQKVFKDGKNLWRTLEEDRIAAVRAAANAAKAEAGGGDIRDVQRAKAEGRTALAALTEKHWNLRSFREVLDLAFGEDSATAKRFGVAARKAFTARTKAMIQLQRRWKDAMERATGKTGRAARQVVFDMQAKQTIEELVSPQIYHEIRIPIDTFFDAKKKSDLGLSQEEATRLTEQFENLPPDSKRKYLTIERQIKTGEGAARMAKFTEAEVLHLTMLWAQTGYRDALKKHGFGADFQAAVEAKLSPGAKSLREWLADYYQSEFPALAAIYRRMFGVDLRQTENYAPGTFWHTGTNESPVDPSAGIVTGGNFKQGMGVGGDFAQGFLKQRKKHTAAPRIQNAFDLFFSHANQTEHWKALAELSREMHGVFGNPAVKIAMEARSPAAANALREWLKAIDGNGVAMAPAGKLMRYLLESQAYMAMAWKISTAAKNAIGSTLNAAYGMPLHEYVRGIARLAAGKLEVGDILKSDAIQNKIEGGYAPEVRAAVTQAINGKPTLRGDILIHGLEIHGKVDAIGSSIGAAICFDYHFRKAQKEGLSEAQALAAATEITQDSIARLTQPAEVIDRSLFELNLGTFGKLMFLFASEARQKSSLYLTALGHTATLKATRKDLRVLFISHLVIAPLMRAVGAAFADAFDPDDEELFDEKYWNPRDFLVSALTGPLSGIPLLRDIFSGFSGSNSPLGNYYRGGKSLYDLFAKEPTGDETHWYESKIQQVLQGIGAFPGVAGNVYKQVAGAARNATGD